MWSVVIAEFLKIINRIMSSTQSRIQRVINIYDEMHRVLAVTHAERFLVLRAHNGGGVIKPSGPLYASVLYQDYDKPFEDVKQKYQNFPVDKEYARMLLDIMQNKKVYYDTMDMPESVLKHIYINEGVRHVFIHYLGQDRKNIYFCSVATSKKVLTWKNTGDEMEIDIAANLIRQNIK